MLNTATENMEQRQNQDTNHSHHLGHMPNNTIEAECKIGLEDVHGKPHVAS